MIVCVLLPRFALTVAAGGRDALAAGPLALAPEVGREPVVGETSAAAEAHGVRAGLRLGEALARCPTLRLVTPDPAGVSDAWEHVVAALESIGAAVETDRPGMAWFEERGLRGLHGGTVETVIAVARRALSSTSGEPQASVRFGASAGTTPVRAPAPASSRAPAPPSSRAPAPASSLAPGARAVAGSGPRAVEAGAHASAETEPRAVGAGARIGVAASRFAALAAAHRARARRPEIAPEAPASLAAYMAPLPVSLLCSRPEVAALPDALERFGIVTLGDLAKLSRAALADRFGAPGLLARDLARGRDTPLRPRVPSERLQEVLELPESASGPQL